FGANALSCHVYFPTRAILSLESLTIAVLLISLFNSLLLVFRFTFFLTPLAAHAVCESRIPKFLAPVNQHTHLPSPAKLRQVAMPQRLRHSLRKDCRFNYGELIVDN